MKQVQDVVLPFLLAFLSDLKVINAESVAERIVDASRILAGCSDVAPAGGEATLLVA